MHARSTEDIESQDKIAEGQGQDQGGTQFTCEIGGTNNPAQYENRLI